MQYKVLLLIAVSLMGSGSALATDSGTSEPRPRTDKQMAKRSKNSMREELAGELKNSLTNCAKVLNEVTDVQKKVATLIEKFTDGADDLVNQSPTHSDLAEALRAVTKANKAMDAIVAEVNSKVHLGGSKDETEA